MATAIDPPNGHASAALDSLQAHSIVPLDYSLAQAQAHPLYGRLLRMYAGALSRGERPYPPPAHIRPAVMSPDVPHVRYPNTHHWASPAWVRHAQPFDAKAAAAGIDKD